MSNLLDNSVVIHNSKPPLRWFANEFCHRVSMWFFNIGLKANDRFTYDYESYKFRHFLMEKIGWRMHKIFDYPYTKWGTYYKISPEYLKELKEEINRPRWNDYDSDGIPYWYYLWSNDEQTGDGWRLIRQEDPNQLRFNLYS